MSDLIEQLKKSEKLCKDTYSESTIITRLTLKRIISALEESAKEPQKQTFVTDLCENLELVKLHFGEEENQCLADEIIGTAIGTLKELDAKWRNNQPQVQPIMRSAEEIIDTFNTIQCDAIASRGDWGKVDNKFDFNGQLRQYWINWLTGKEV